MSRRCSDCGIPDTHTKWFSGLKMWLCPLCWPPLEIHVYTPTNVAELVRDVSEIIKTPKWFICVECKQPIDKRSQHIRPDGYPIVVWFVDQPYHRGCAPECERCRDAATNEMAHANDQLVHLVCLREGEEID